jgi:hypothetical protein
MSALFGMVLLIESSALVLVGVAKLISLCFPHGVEKNSSRFKKVDVHGNPIVGSNIKPSRFLNNE